MSVFHPFNRKPDQLRKRGKPSTAFSQTLLIRTSSTLPVSHHFLLLHRQPPDTLHRQTPDTLHRHLHALHLQQTGRRRPLLLTLTLATVHMFQQGLSLSNLNTDQVRPLRSLSQQCLLAQSPGAQSHPAPLPKPRRLAERAHRLTVIDLYWDVVSL